MKRIKAKGLLCLTALVLLLAPTRAVTQELNSEPKHLVSSGAGGACELNNLYIDLLVVEAKNPNRGFLSSPGRAKAKHIN